MSSIEIEDIGFLSPESVYPEIKPHIHHTPILKGRYFNEILDAEVLFKCENFQKTGSFKIRGAMHAVGKKLSSGNIRAVATHSSGNFGQALAFAAGQYGIRCHIVVPKNAPMAKVQAMQGYGAEIEFCEPGTQNRERALQNYLQQHPDSVFIHPYNQKEVIEGHMTLVSELKIDGINPDIILVPVGGGGLISGISLASSHYFPGCTVIGAEPENANDAFLSVKKGEIVHLTEVNTIADGLRTSLGDITFSVIREKVREIITITEEEILLAQKEIMGRLKIVAEPSSATVWAAAKKIKNQLAGKTIVLVISGGNVDF
ncbi:MAG: pyridoxal-phosphate dependent enzyme [Bacteroidia bacterium]|nr:pyridoxal-phosphate dependent enzyme [Bacteroidia bacterium]